MAFEKVVLPTYSKTEEILNSVSHGLGIPLGVLFMLFGIWHSTSTNGAVAAIVFGVATIIMYSSSTLYHCLKPGTAKKAFRLIDHSAIFIMITGTASAINIMAVYPHDKVFCVITATLSIVLSIVGIALTFIDQEKYKKVQMRLYMVVGYTSVLMIYPIAKYYKGESLVPFILALVGGISYSVGVVFYKIGKKKPYFHSVFHLFVLAGTLLHFAMLYIALGKI